MISDDIWCNIDFMTINIYQLTITLYIYIFILWFLWRVDEKIALYPQCIAILMEKVMISHGILCEE